MSEDPPFDLKSLMERCFGEKAFVRELLSIFQSQAARELAALNEAVREGDTAQVVAVTHKLKGSAANISAERLRQLCGELEESAKAGRSEGFADQSGKISDEIGRCGTALPAIFATLQ